MRKRKFSEAENHISYFTETDGPIQTWQPYELHNGTRDYSSIKIIDGYTWFKIALK